MVLCCALAGFAPGAAAQDTVTVEGVVVNKVTGAGIPDAVVLLWRTNTASFRAATNEAGIFQFTGLEPGDYSSSAEKGGYSSPEAEALTLFENRPKLHLSSGAETVRLRFELNPPAVLRGRVIDADGNPARATIELGSGKTTNTDADGAFSLEKLWPGQYTLLARPILTNRAAEHVSAKDEIRTEPVPTYYPSVQDRSLAEAITVRAGAELNGYEIRLQSAEVHRVRGIVLDPDGKPAAKAVVQLRAKIVDNPGLTIRGFAGKGLAYFFRNGPVGGQADEEPVTTAEDGMFEFPSVRIGEWTAQATSAWVHDGVRNQNTLRLGGTAFRVEHQDLDELKISFATPVSLSLPVALVLSDGSLPTPGVSVAVMLMSDTAPTTVVTQIDAGGLLHFNEALPGTSQIRADVEAGNYYVDSILLGSTDITGQSVELTPASPPLKIVLKPAGTVRGSIEDGDAATVVLFPPNFTGRGYSVQSSGKAFELTGIPPGEYNAIALDRLDPSAMTDASRLRGLMPRATSVRLEPGSTASVQLKINHVPE